MTQWPSSTRSSYNTDGPAWVPLKWEFMSFAALKHSPTRRKCSLHLSFQLLLFPRSKYTRIFYPGIQRSGEKNKKQKTSQIEVYVLLENCSPHRSHCISLLLLKRTKWSIVVKSRKPSTTLHFKCIVWHIPNEVYTCEPTTKIRI